MTVHTARDTSLEALQQVMDRLCAPDLTLVEAKELRRLLWTLLDSIQGADRSPAPVDSSVHASLRWPSQPVSGRSSRVISLFCPIGSLRR
jgi:hypothetical protein